MIIIALFSCNSPDTKNPSYQRSQKQISVDTCNYEKPTKEMIAEVAKKQQSAFQPTELNKITETQRICAGQMPSGWLKISGQWDPTSCGNPTTIFENVWFIEEYDNKPIGSIMTICAQPIPKGWVKISGSWNPTMCGSPTAIVENVIQIKRLN